MSRLRGGVVVLLALSLGSTFAAGCKDDESSTPRDGGVDQPAVKPDGPVCKRPPLSECIPPPHGACTKYWRCPGCICSGPNKIAACDPVTKDCRYFCDGCYPAEYRLCDPETVSKYPQHGARCGYCFLSDAGPGRCNIIGPFDGGPGDSGAVDAGAGDAS